MDGYASERGLVEAFSDPGSIPGESTMAKGMLARAIDLLRWLEWSGTAHWTDEHGEDHSGDCCLACGALKTGSAAGDGVHVDGCEVAQLLRDTSPPPVLGLGMDSIPLGDVEVHTPHRTYAGGAYLGYMKPTSKLKVDGWMVQIVSEAGNEGWLLRTLLLGSAREPELRQVPDRIETSAGVYITGMRAAINEALRLLLGHSPLELAELIEER